MFGERCFLVEKIDENGLKTYEPQKLPDCVIRVTEAGNFVISEEDVDHGRVKKVMEKFSDGGEPRHWTEEELEERESHAVYYSNVDGGYIGTQEWYDLLVKKLKLVLIQKTDANHKTCSIGYCPDENKWYGWSHRALHGFSIGDVVKKDDLTTHSGFMDEYAIQHPDEDLSLPVGYEARDLNGAKRMAIAFARAVG